MIVWEQNADFPNGGEADWGTGFGLLYVYLDDMYSPVISTLSFSLFFLNWH